MAYNKTNPNGQATMANSSPVAIASNQSAVPVSAASLPLPTGAATEASLANIAAAIKAEDAAHVSGDTGIMAQAVRNDSLGTTLTSANGDISPIAVSSTGAVFISTTSLVPGTSATNLGKAEDAVHSSGDTGVMSLGVRRDTAAASSGTTGDYEPFSTDALGKLWTADNQVEDAAHTSGDRGSFVLGIGNEAQTTLAADGDYIGNSVDTKGNGMVVGNIASDGVDSGNPVKTGGQARTTNPTAVADADRTNFIADKLGKQVVVGSIRDLKADQPTTITSSTTETTIVTAVASTFCDLYGLIVTNTSATATEVVFRDVTAGTARFSIQVPAGDTRGFMLPESAAYKQATVNTAWTAQCSASVASIKISALYVKNI